MSKSDIWMPIYIGDYLSDTMRLTTLQHGAYFLLMLEYWKQGPLPNDMAELAAIAKQDKRAWEKEVWPTLRRFFSVQDDGLLHQKRMDKERASAADRKTKRTAAANARWKGKDKQEASNADAKADANASALDEQNACIKDAPRASCASALPSPSPSSLRSENTLTTFGTPAAPSSPDEDPPAPTLAAPKAKTPMPPDQRAALFGIGTQIVCAMTGKPTRATKELIGKWLKDMRDDCAVLNTIIQEAADTRPADPVAWITAAVKARSGSKLDAMARDWRLDEIDLDAAAEEDCRRQGI
ncbi:DUF1376 domain-containing protein [Gluconacetobacter entanii]|uniref:DUF1376 domain-containing protein n=1 Tax=Gluconacetobacter entanii TaxID=108528 RepID=A0ABT3K5G9_9PROT|nr:DUF1376 domain-containing protein [Gluconacetobacter entanii]MCW4590421.1 DUF1376 domain-containing protein [Gluconacetobacter entanii]MCW4594347.1 DUF1376 domain-containing protein [Gluconacetobacter entanii]NPC88172.1 DUF1376 domain-containing protein [Gluconacetobacter entanii]